MSNRFLCISLSLVLSALSITVQAAPLKVMTSITPIQLIAVEVLDGVADVEVLLPAGASPHQYTLRPSDMKAINHADLFVWVGADLERFLVKVSEQTPAKVLTLLEEEHADEKKVVHDNHHEDEHDHQGEDPHIWLDPEHALEVAEAIRAAVIAINPGVQSQVDANYADFSARLMALDKQISLQLAPLSKRGFLVFHDAYGRFIEHYQLKMLDAISINPSRKPGAKHVAQLRDYVARSEAVCMFSEPQFSASTVQTITAGSQVKVMELDPLGQSIAVKKGGYTQFLADFAHRFEQCLTP